MSTRSYQLINPTIEGTFNDTYDAETPIGAAEKMWVALTPHFVGHVPRFYVTMKEISGGSYHHFKIRENEKTKKYNIKEVDLKLSSKNTKDLFDNFLTNIDDFNKKEESKQGDKHEGGKRKRYEDDSSSSSSSSSAYPFPRVRKYLPLGALHYMPDIYCAPYLRTNTTLNPSFNSILAIPPVSIPVPRPPLATYCYNWAISRGPWWR